MLMNSLRRAASPLPACADLAPASAGLAPSNAAATASTPVGVMSIRAEAINLCNANLGASARRRDVWNAKEAHSCWAFHRMTGEKIAQASSEATYGSQRR